MKLIYYFILMLSLLIISNGLLNRLPITKNIRKFSSKLSSSKLDNEIKSRNIIARMSAASVASAAVVAAAAVNAAVGMRPLQAPDISKTYVYINGANTNRTGVVDEVGLPLIYDKDLIQIYWKNQGSALTQRWTEFLGYTVPYLTKIITLIVSGGTSELQKNSGVLARDARVIMEKLGPTYIKLGQMMSVRPDVLPKEALQELQILQDSVKPFDTKIAINQIEKELNQPLGAVFSEISEVPVAAASLAQVYKAKLQSTGEYVAVKIQRPKVLELVSKDLYVLRRAAEVYQGLIERFVPKQRTNYVALLNEWAVGFYTELDFLNEASNQERLKNLLIAENVDSIYIPRVYKEYCTRRILVSEWIDGIKLSDCPKDQIKSVIPGAQEAFLTQLLQVGFFHADPHPGNLLYMKEKRGNAQVALIDFGLVAAVKQKDMDTMISCIIHLANNDYASLVDDFIQLEILPADCDRSLVVPLMNKALTPYVKGGGAQKYEEELKKTYGLDGSFRGNAGGFQAMTQDALTVMNDIPFSIPPYFALLGRAIITLEGIALTGDPNYGIIMEAYPFVARKLLSEERPEIQKALQKVLYSSSSSLQSTRLSVLINSALGVISKSTDSFIDLDSIPEDSITIETSIKFLLSDKSKSLRNILTNELSTGFDLILRQRIRRAYSELSSRITNLPFINNFINKPENIPIPVFIPSIELLDQLKLSSNPTVSLTTTLRSNQQITTKMVKSNEIIDVLLPKLSREEELYMISINDLFNRYLGDDYNSIINGKLFTSPLLFVQLAVTTIGSISNISSNIQLNNFINNLTKQLNKGLDSIISSRSYNKSNKESNNNIQDIIKAINTLDNNEKVILQRFVNDIIYQLLYRNVNRLQKLKQ